MKKLAIICFLSLILVLSGCSVFNPGTYVAKAPAENNPALQTVTPQEGAYVGTGIYPSKYEIGNPVGYYPGLTLDLEFEIFNGLPYASPVAIAIAKPYDHTLEKRAELGFEWWPATNKYVEIVDGGEYLGAYDSRTITVRMYIPPDDEVVTPHKWIYWIAYQNTGQLWGAYKETRFGNFIFYPGSFSWDASDYGISASWETWGNSPPIIVRAKANEPPKDIDDGRLVYQGTGEQIIKDWVNEKGNVVDRQYTLFEFADANSLSSLGNELYFYKAWIAHRGKNGQLDGIWYPLDASTTATMVFAEVQVTMK